ncbi:MAG: AbrB/MazE/SpoVT family DNA-binding domain-containing protein [Candidatus Aenigmarchaeota archaeon]|nr:AbrB/MazE/SpoVT family DNA-binding domain-containing protein [Candidatus Aenigmarchaeota archaeon]
MSAKQVNIDKWEKIPCECGKMADKASLTYRNYQVRGWKCHKCGKSYIHPADSLKISKLEKLSGMKVKIGVVGQSLVLRIPKSMAELYDLEKGELVELVPEDLKRLEIKIKG